MKQSCFLWLLVLLCLAGCGIRQPDAQPALREPDPTVQNSPSPEEVGEPPAPTYVDVGGAYRVTVNRDRYSSEVIQFLLTKEGMAEISLESKDGLAEAFPSAYSVIMEEAPGVWLQTFGADGSGGGNSVRIDPEAQVISGCFREADATAYLLLEMPEGQVLQLPNGDLMPLDGLFSDEAESRWLLETPDGLVLLCPDGQAVALGAQREILWTERFSGEILTAMETEDQRLLVLTQWDNLAMLQTLDPATGRLTPVGAVPQALCGCKMTPGGRWGYDLLAWDSEGLYGWRAGTETIDRRFTWESLDLQGQQIQALVCLTETELVVGRWNEEEGHQEKLFVFLEEAPA